MAKGSELSLASEIYNTLKERILNLNYRPGEILLMQQVVNELKVSRTPVKEAMVRLVSDGYMEMYDNRYFRVKEISVDTVMEILEARQVLESYIVEQLAPKVTDDQIRTLSENVVQTDNASASHDNRGVMLFDEQFHTHLFDFVGNQAMLEIFQGLNERIRALRFMTQGAGHTYVIGEEHRKIIDALKNHNPELAKSTMLQHLQRVQSYMKEVLENRAHPLIANTVLRNNIRGKSTTG